MKDQKVITRQISRKLESIKALKEQMRGVTSWSEYLRLGLGMSVSQLALRLGVSPASVSEAEKAEREGRITINKLRKTAEALECDLVYAFIPRKQLEEIIKDQALKKSLELMRHAETHMSLEDQKVNLDEDERLKDLIEEKILSKRLWDK